MSRKYKKIWTILNYSEYFLILASATSGSISGGFFASFRGISTRVTISEIGLKLWNSCRNKKV